jgi:hypothetical protein
VENIMADAAHTIAGLTPAVMAAGLVHHNLRYLKKKKKRGIVGLGVDNLVGTSLIQATAGTW